MALSEQSRAALIPLLVASLAVVVFLNALPNDFVWDDTELIVDNPAVHSLSNTANFFASHFWFRTDQPSAQGYYRPLILLSYTVDYLFWGPNPLGFRLRNVIWHAIASALVCLLVMRLTASQAASLIAGSLFAVHPVHVESVAFISGRTDVIATGFSLAALLLFLRQRDSQRLTLAGPLSVCLFALALLAKEVAAVVPMLALIGDFVIPARDGRRAHPAMHVALWLVLGLYATARFGLLGIAPHLETRLSATELLFTMPIIMIDYVRLLIFPVNLCADYAVAVRHSASLSSIAAIVLVAVGCVAIAVLLVRRKRVGYFAVWIVLGLLPVLQVVPISVLKAERFLYLPSVGFCALVGMLGATATERLGKSGRSLVVAVFALIIIALSFRTAERNTVWRDEFTLYRITERCAPGNFRIQYNLGNAYYRRGDIADAIYHTEIAQRLRPGFPQVCYNLGLMYTDSGRLGEAEAMYRRAIEADPAYVRARNNLAALLYSTGRLDEARAEWSAALSIDPTLDTAREGLRLIEEASR